MLSEALSRQRAYLGAPGMKRVCVMALAPPVLLPRSSPPIVCTQVQACPLLTQSPQLVRRNRLPGCLGRTGGWRLASCTTRAGCCVPPACPRRRGTRWRCPRPNACPAHDARVAAWLRAVERKRRTTSSMYSLTRCGLKIKLLLLIRQGLCC